MNRIFIKSLTTTQVSGTGKNPHLLGRCETVAQIEKKYQNVFHSHFLKLCQIEQN